VEVVAPVRAAVQESGGTPEEKPHVQREVPEQGGAEVKAILLIALLILCTGCVTLDPDDYNEETNSTPVTAWEVKW
jgi:hypothetical protein